MEKGKTMKSLENDIAVELLERSKLYFEYQETQYAAALDRIRKLEEKGLNQYVGRSLKVNGSLCREEIIFWITQEIQRT
ncbi:Uncharacterised protein [Serratia plymuthica]|nr:Uncharacterised protein [Serratia plymuthica]